MSRSSDETLRSPAFTPASGLFRVLMSAISIGGAGSRLSVLIYHRVLPKQDPLFPNEVDACAFDRQMCLLRSCFNILTLSDAVKRLRDGKLPSRAACITFDDGYADNAEVALPILN